VRPTLDREWTGENTFDQDEEERLALIAMVSKLKEERSKLMAEWFKKGQMSVKRKNKSGCCCIINDDGDIEELCLAHEEYIKEKLNG
jgi:hypothetical protein